MSVIEKMSIMGIRSFGPEDQDRQVVHFFKPLTLILGPNGTGKTTIIECLRYITAGDMPPNSDRGGSFVHDPKFTTQREVKAQVKLQFRDVTGSKVTATRSLMVTQAAKKLMFKTLEGTITRQNAHGLKTHLSSKCADMDAEMIGSLGVSKAILNNVIFCHQEESNWPLSEGKALKQRFDDIFAATRYIKALEEIRKISNEKKNEIKLFESQVDSLVGNKRKAEEFQKELEQAESRLLACRNNLADLVNQLEPVLNKLDEIKGKENEIGKLQYTLETNTNMIQTYVQQENDFKKSIANFFEGSKDDLKEEMSNFDTLVTQKKRKLEKLQQEMKKLDSQLQQDIKSKNQLVEVLWKLKSEFEKHKELVNLRDNKLRTLRKNLGMGDLGFDEDEPLVDSQVTNVLRNLRQRNSSTQIEYQNSKVKLEAAEKSAQDEIQEKLMGKAKKQMNLQNNNAQMAKNKVTLRNIADELKRLENLMKRQDELERDVKEAESELTSFEDSVNIDELRQQLSSKQQHKSEMESKLTALNQEMLSLHKEGKVRQEIEIVNKEMHTKQDEVDKVLNRHKDTLLHLLKEVPTYGFHDKVNSLVEKLNKKIAEANKDLDKKKSKLTSLETTRKHKMDELSAKKKTLNEQQNRIFDACGSQDFESGYESLASNIKELQDEKGAMTGSLFFFNQYVEKLKKPRPCCPLCTRSFERNEEALALVNKLQKKLQSIPSSLEDKERLITQKENRMKTLLELKPVKENVSLLLTKEIPELEKSIEGISCEVMRLNTSITEAEEVLDDLNSDLKMASGITSELYMLDKNKTEMEKRVRKLAELKSKIGGRVDTSRTVDQVSKEQGSLQDLLRAVGGEVDSLHEEINSHREQVQQLREKVNNLRATQNDACRDLQKKNSLVEQQGSITRENAALLEATKELKEEISSFETILKELNKLKEEATKSKEKELEKINAKIREEEKETEAIENLTKEINLYIDQDQERKLVAHEDKVSTLSEKIKEKKEKVSQMDTQDRDLAKDITSQELKYRELEDNLKLMETTEKITKLNDECLRLRQQIGGHNYKSLRVEKEKLLQQERDLNRQRDEQTLREATFKENIRNCKRQLQDEMFKDAEKKHLHKCIELKTTKHAVDDLSKYYTALNKAIMSYHQMKMSEINKIVRDLWIKTYSGNDIDYIEIQSDEDSSGLEKAKRNFNYRVVMFKGDTPTDMRGRCSAGQKVLASLIIRLALAETFCLNCGILALDEPTTNLDRENIGNLARALVEIVESRVEQRNFQLIIITHDEDFIDRFGRSGVVEHYYRVSKDSNAFSKISKLAIKSA